MIQAICWMLIHSVWQGLFFTIITGLVLLYTRKSRAAVRYNLLCGLFFLFLVVCVLTFILEWNHPGGGVASLQEPISYSENCISFFIGRLNDYLSEQAPLIVLVWCMVFLFKCVRMAAALVYTQRVRNYGVAEPAIYWKDKTLSFCRLLKINKTVRLLESKLVKMPFVTGHWKPVIFIPLGLLTNLPEGEIEAVLLHELAHIRRNDYFMNFLQTIGENIFFFNPGMLWISSLLREERENCCDDMAIDRTKNKMEFVRALISFREHDLRLAGITVPFSANRHQLLQRVTRIVHNKNKSLNRAERIFLLISFCIIILLLAASTHQAGRPSDSRYKITGENSKNGPLYVPVLTDVDAKPGNPERSQDQVPPGGLAYDHGVAGVPIDNPVDADPAVSDVLVRSAKVAERALSNLSNRREEEGHPEIQANEERERMEQDREQAIKDVEQAIKDRKQVEEDREQSRLDQLQAERDQEQSRLDKMQEERDAFQEQAERAEAVIEKVQAIEQRKQAERDRILSPSYKFPRTNPRN